MKRTGLIISNNMCPSSHSVCCAFPSVANQVIHERSTELNGKINNTTRRSNESFPEKLAETMRSPHGQGAIWWNPEGSVFCLLPRQFTKQVLQNIFQGTKLESFQRKMKRWGFERCFDTSFPRGALVYHHPYFQRDRPELMKQMSAGMKKSTIRPVLKRKEDAIPSVSQTTLPATPTIEGSFYSQQLPQQLLTAERLRFSMQPTVRDLCLQTVPLDPLLLHYLTTNHRSNPLAPAPRMPPPFVDLSHVPMLRLLQLRELLSRHSSS
jgi:hypothetical protein